MDEPNTGHVSGRDLLARLDRIERGLSALSSWFSVWGESGDGRESLAVPTSDCERANAGARRFLQEFPPPTFPEDVERALDAEDEGQALCGRCGHERIYHQSEGCRVADGSRGGCGCPTFVPPGGEPFRKKPTTGDPVADAARGLGLTADEAGAGFQRFRSSLDDQSNLEHQLRLFADAVEANHAGTYLQVFGMGDTESDLGPRMDAVDTIRAAAGIKGPINWDPRVKWSDWSRGYRFYTIARDVPVWRREEIRAEAPGSAVEVPLSIALDLTRPDPELPPDCEVWRSPGRPSVTAENRDVTDVREANRRELLSLGSQCLFVVYSENGGMVERWVGDRYPNAEFLWRGPHRLTAGKFFAVLSDVSQADAVRVRAAMPRDCKEVPSS